MSIVDGTHGWNRSYRGCGLDDRESVGLRRREGGVRAHYGDGVITGFGGGCDRCRVDRRLAACIRPSEGKAGRCAGDRRGDRDGNTPALRSAIRHTAHDVGALRPSLTPPDDRSVRLDRERLV